MKPHLDIFREKRRGNKWNIWVCWCPSCSKSHTSHPSRLTPNSWISPHKNSRGLLCRKGDYNVALKNTPEILWFQNFQARIWLRFENDPCRMKCRSQRALNRRTDRCSGSVSSRHQSEWFSPQTTCELDLFSADLTLLTNRCVLRPCRLKLINVFIL